MIKVDIFCELIEKQQIEQLKKEHLYCGGNVDGCKTSVISYKEYIQINIGKKDRYLIDKDGNIFGTNYHCEIIKGQSYGTIYDLDKYWWGTYYPSCYKLDGSLIDQ